MADSIIESRSPSVDPEIAGPIPSNTDTRSRDVLQEQEDKQRGRQAVGDSIIDAPSIPPQEPIDVSPPPPMPSMFGGMQSVYDIAKEAAYDVFRDGIKNLSINGITPDISNGEVSFRIPTEPSASSSFASMNGLDIYTSPQEFSVQPPTITQQTVSPASFEKQQIENIQNQITETNANSLTQPPIDLNVPQETMVSDSVNVRVEESKNEQNITQRSWSNYEGDNPIKRKVGTGFYAESRTHGPELRPIGEGDGGARGSEQYQKSPPIATDVKSGEKTEVPQSITNQIRNLLELDPSANDFLSNAEKPKDYVSANDPFAQYVFFDVCSNGQPSRFLIPAFGPFPQ